MQRTRGSSAADAKEAAFACARHGGYSRAMIRALRILAVVLIVLLGAGWGAAMLARAPGEGLAESFARLFAGAPAAVPPSAGGIALPPGSQVGGPFRLVDHTGREVSEADYRGKVALIFFGFTFCPDVCPTELSNMAAAMDQLGPQADRVVPIFVTVDPERDTVPRMADYVALFHPRIVGLTGSPEQVAAAARAFRVYYAKATPPGATEYVMDHSAFTYVLGPDGAVRTLLRPGASPGDIVEAVRRNLG